MTAKKKTVTTRNKRTRTATARNKKKTPVAPEPEVSFSEIEKWGDRIGDAKPPVRVYVQKPRGRNTGSVLATFDFLPEREDVARAVGKGRFKLLVLKKNDRGSYTYAACRTLTITADLLKAVAA